MKTTAFILLLFIFSIVTNCDLKAGQLSTDSQAQVTIPFGKSYDYNNILVNRVIDGDTIQLAAGRNVLTPKI